MKKLILILSLLLIFLLCICSSLIYDTHTKDKEKPTATTAPITTTIASAQTSEKDLPVLKPTEKPDLLAPTVCIDAGHGFNDPGASASINGSIVYEKDINAALAAKLASALEALGYNVMFTHNAKDLPEERFLSDFEGGKAFLQNERAAFIKEHSDEIDIFISLHCSSSGYYITQKGSNGYNASYSMLAKILPAVRKALKLSKEPIWHNDGSEILDTGIPSLLIECGFITKYNNLVDLVSDDWQNKFTNALAEGIHVYAKDNIVKTPTTEPIVTTPPTPSTTAPTLPENAPTVCIDPGHGFVDPGAIGKLNGKEIYESTINMQVSLKLKSALESMGYRVIMTHNGVDIPDPKYVSYLGGEPAFYVNERNMWLNDNISSFDLLISVHCNSNTSSQPSGSRYYITSVSGYGNFNTSHTLMAKILTAVKTGLSLAKEPTWARQNLAVLKILHPAVLVECGFVSNTSDLEKLIDEEWQTMYAKSLANGIAAYIEDYIKK